MHFSSVSGIYEDCRLINLIALGAEMAGTRVQKYTSFESKSDELLDPRLSFMFVRQRS